MVETGGQGPETQIELHDARAAAFDGGTNRRIGLGRDLIQDAAELGNVAPAP